MDYGCEFNGEGEHSHVGVRPYLHKVIDAERRLVDGETGEKLEKQENVEPR
jgi:hypothetical protein